MNATAISRYLGTDLSLNGQVTIGDLRNFGKSLRTTPVDVLDLLESGLPAEGGRSCFEGKPELVSIRADRVFNSQIAIRDLFAMLAFSRR